MAADRRRRAFTLIEILTAVAITTVIVFALVSMFNTSTKALQAANRQVDIWEASRSAFGLLESSIGEVTTGSSPDRLNFFAACPDALELPIPNFGAEYLRQQDIYTVSQENNRWIVNVYLLQPAGGAVRTLYRFQTNYPAFASTFGDVLPVDLPLADPGHPLNVALGTPADQLSKVAEGVIHLHVVPYTTDGRAYTNTDFRATSGLDYEVLRSPYSGTGTGGESFSFYRETLPASVDLEMFVLEPDRIEEFKAQSGDIAKRLYIEKHIGSIQLFRTRIPIRKDVLARQ